MVNALATVVVWAASLVAEVTGSPSAPPRGQADAGRPELGCCGVR